LVKVRASPMRSPNGFANCQTFVSVDAVLDKSRDGNLVRAG